MFENPGLTRSFALKKLFLLKLSIPGEGGSRGGWLQCTTHLAFFYNSKSIGSIFLIFLNFNKLSKVHLWPKIQGHTPYLGLFTALLSLHLKNPKI